LTQRNLHAVLGFVNVNDPGNSPVLILPAQPHGPARTPIFNDHHAAQYRRLVDWVYQVSHQPSPDGPAVASRPASAAPVVSAPFSTPLGQVQPTAAGKPPRVSRSPGQAAAAAKAARPASTGGVVLTAGTEPVDPDSSAGPAARQDSAFSPSGIPSPGGRQSPRMKRGAPIPVFTPADPFDPEIFNRQQLNPGGDSAGRKGPAE
jgi:hypothetical protein